MLLLLAMLQPKAPVTFVDLTKDKDPSIVWFILATFGLIGLLIAITVGLGAGVGILRIWVMRRFPGNAFNGPDDEPTIRLHLNESPEPAPEHWKA